MAFFQRSDNTPKKPGFFQRVREAVGGGPGAGTRITPDEVPLPVAPPGSPAPVPLGLAADDLVPASVDELAFTEGLETPAAPTFVVEREGRESALIGERPDAPTDGRNEFGLRPVSSTFSFGGYATAADEDESFLERMRTAAARTRTQFASSLDGVLSLTRQVDAETLDELEAVLLTADIGLTTTQEIIGKLRTRALREKATGAELRTMLREELLAVLDSVDQPTNHPAASPEVIMMVGVNGTGKTTTSGKLAALYGTHGRRALLCAADTFRAAAIDQLEVWAQRSNVDIIKTRQGGDPSAALYDALTAGKARKADIVIVDTAGRLHNKAGLMAELDKMRRTAEKLVPGAPHQTFLVMDATTGQNGLQQARLFLDAARVSGIVLTKLDGTAKGGIVITIARELRLPVVFVGVGEKMEDIVPFDNRNFIDSLLGESPA
jgi:fused signal recognition particle receptor